MKRKSTAVWKGPGKTGTGHLSTQSSVLNNTPYSYLSRFESGDGTNPEELIAAAHAGCFSMKLSFLLNAAGFTADEINTTCEITLHEGNITDSALTVQVTVPAIGKDQFIEIVNEAKLTCPVSKLLKATITAEATLS